MKTLTLMLLILAAIAMTACDPFTTETNQQHDQQCRISEASVLAQMEVAKSSAAAAIEVQKRCTALQMEVLKQCAEHGNIPIFQNGNIDCKPAPAKLPVGAR